MLKERIDAVIGFTDILLGDTSDEDVWDEGKAGKIYDVQHPSRFCMATQRGEQVAHAYPELRGVKFLCSEPPECRGAPRNKDGSIPSSRSSMLGCQRCLAKNGVEDADALIVGSTVHPLQTRGTGDTKHPHAADKVIHDIQWLRKQHKNNMIWTSGPSVTKKLMTKSQAEILTDSNLAGGALVYHKTCGGGEDGDHGNCLDMKHVRLKTATRSAAASPTGGKSSLLHDCFRIFISDCLVPR